ncbi:MAG: glycosyltransferase family 2 protein [Anaerolineae bacterium]|nr:glycosyltransferase family 2 protein [Anaerolineae bacterium]
MADLSIIIVSWNVRDLLTACLASIHHPGAEVIVVDSGSSDGSAAMVRERFPWARLIALDHNAGFTAGNNTGLRASTGRYVMLLNPDTEVIGDALQQMVAYLDAHSDVGVVGPHTLNSDGTTQSTRRRFPTLPTAFFESTWLQPCAPRRILDRYYVAGPPDDATLDVDWVQGSALMARRAVYEQVGGLDEGYVMYSEEMDWCRRIKDAGWRVVYLGSAQIVHHGGKSSEQVTARRHIHFNTSKVRYFRKHHGALAAETLRAFLLLNYAWQLLLEAFKGALGHKRPVRRARVKAYWQVLKSRLRE